MYAGHDFFFSYNELSIDDNILLYNTRSTAFINYLNKIDFQGPHSAFYYSGEIQEELDLVYLFGF